MELSERAVEAVRQRDHLDVDLGVVDALVGPEDDRAGDARAGAADVLGADRTLVVWEQHTDFVPTNPEPQVRWVERDDNEIYVLVGLANRLLDALSPDAARTR